jgi:hypothetical protein
MARSHGQAVSGKFSGAQQLQFPALLRRSCNHCSACDVIPQTCESTAPAAGRSMF